MAAIEEQGGEITPEQEEALAITEANFIQKAPAYGRIIQYYDALAAAAKAEEERIHTLRQRAEKQAEGFRRRIVAAMIEFERPKVDEDPTVILSLRKSEPTVIDDAEKIPDSYLTKTLTVSPDKAAIKAAIKAGTEVPGAHLEVNYSLQIK